MRRVRQFRIGENVVRVSKNMSKYGCRFTWQIAAVAVIVIGALSQILVASGDVKNSDHKADKNLKSTARINPSTLAMEFEIPMANYPGRSGNGFPVALNYSSKLWRINPILLWWNHTPFGELIYNTNTSPYFAERSAAGWTSSLLPPHIVEKLELYNDSGDPLSALFSENQFLQLNSDPSANLFGNICVRHCEYENGVATHCTDWVCNCPPGEACDGGGTSGGTGGGIGNPPPPQSRYYIKRVRVQLSDGSTHEFRKDDAVHPFCIGGPGDPNTCQNTDGEDRQGTFLSVDGSALRLERGVSYDAQTKDVLYLPNGTRYVFPVGTSSSTPQGIYTPAEKSIDASGNISAFNSTTNTWTDTLGRNIPDVLPRNWMQQTQTAGTQDVSLPGSAQGGDLTYKLKWDTLADSFDSDLPVEDRELSYAGRHSACNNQLYTTISPALFTQGEANTRVCAKLIGSTPEKFNPTVLTEIQMPDGSKYRFHYDRYAEITRIDYPTGAYERFEYGYVAPLSTEVSPTYDQTNRGVNKRWLYPNDGHPAQYWVYSAGHVGSDYVVVTTAPDGSYSKRHLYESTNSWYGYSDPKSGAESEESSYDPTGQIRSRTLLKYVTKDSSIAGSTVSRDPRVTQRFSLQFEPGSNAALGTFSETEYDEGGSSDPSDFSHLNVKRTKSYQYAVIADKTTVDEEPISWTTVASWFPTSKLASVSETDYSYDASYKAHGILGLPIRSRALDPTNPDPNAPLAKTETIYDNALPNSSSNYGYSMQTYSGVGTSLDCSTNSTPKICWQNPNGAGGSIDLSFRGLPTTSRVWDASTSSWIETHKRYDQFGNAVKAKDPVGNEATTEFDAEYKYAYPTRIITPAPDPNNTGHGTDQTSTASTTYDFNTGLSLSVTDQFDQTIKTEYDKTLRPTRVYAFNFTAPESQTIYGQPDANGSIPESQRFVKTRKQIDPTNWDEATTFVDSLGRTVKTQAKDSQGDVFVETHYDDLGRVDRVTNPYRAGDAVLWSKTRYDEMGRAVESYAPEPLANLANAKSLGVTSFGISPTGDIGTFVLTTDASSRKSRSITNALGQLIRVDEPTGISASADTDLGILSAPAQPTFYTYSPQGKMVKVVQGVQSRYFLYDSLGRLIRVRQPEQEVNSSLNLSDPITGNSGWTAGFTYDLIGNVITAKDAKGTVITNTYDRANRVTTRTYSNEPAGISTPAVSFWYDGKGFASQQSPNFAKGKLTKVDNGISATLYSQFDNLGRLTQSSQLTDGNTYTSGYQYNFAGALIQETYPSGRTVNNEFEIHGDLARVTSRKAGGQVDIPYVSNFAYTASGGISQIKLGNGKWETAKFNNRLQVTELGLGASATDASTWKVNYEYGELDGNGNTDTTKNTGNIARQTLTVPGASFVQSYTYDSLYRLTQAAEKTGTTQNWNQNWGYDRYGNRATFSQNIAGNTAATNPTVDVNTNRFNSGQGFIYDPNGNVKQDVDPVTSHVREFVFNGDNKQSKVRDTTSNETKGEYYYDGEGKRVKKYVPATGETTIFVYSSGKLIAEYSTVVAPAAQAKVSYTTTDHLGTPRVITDSIGQVTSRRDFMPFGEELNAGVGARTGDTGLKYSSATDTIRQKFTGYQKDNETSLDFAEARMYENRFGRFTAVDPLLASGKSANPQSFNRYTYVQNSPMRKTDPTGMVGDYYERNGNYIGTDHLGDGLIYFADVQSRHDGNVTVVNWKETTRLATIRARDEANEPDPIQRLIGGVNVRLDEIRDGSITGFRNALPNFANVTIDGVFSSTGLDRIVEAPHFSKNPYTSDAGRRWGTQIEGAAVIAPFVVGGVFGGGSATSVVPEESPLASFRAPEAMNGARLENLTEGQQARIQNWADKRDVDVTLFGSRARGTAHAGSDFDYFIEANNRIRNNAKFELPRGPVNSGRNRIDVLKPSLYPEFYEKVLSQPHIIFRSN